MITEITRKKLCEYFYPTLNRYRNECDFNENEQKALHNPESDYFECIIAYVHFDADTDNFNKLFIEVVTGHGADPLDVETIVNEEEKQNIIDFTLEHLRKWRKTDHIIEV